MNTVPVEITRTILLNLPYKDILNYYRTNLDVQILCNDIYFGSNV